MSEMKLFLGLNGHANSESLPLRFGISIQQKHQQYPELINQTYDDKGTLGQRQIEIDSGNKHYVGELHIPNEDSSKEDYIFNCRLVLSSPSIGQSPRIITILQVDTNPGDMTVTKHISGMLKRNKISKNELIEYFHPAYKNGLIKDSNDCEEIYQKLRDIRPQEVLPASKSDELILQSSEELTEVVNQFDIEEIQLNEKLTYKELHLSPSIKYKYVMADAYIDNTWQSEDKIWIKALNSKGELQDFHSFKTREHLSQHHEYAFEYFKSRIGQRAYFAICMSEPCRGFLAESVTSIALQLMRK
jgi:hypothetical protein